MKQVYNTGLYWKCVIRKVKINIYKPYGFKCNYYCQEDIHFFDQEGTRKKDLLVKKC